jgi:pimeloyl-ACP methyl ester carboxylesterase
MLRLPPMLPRLLLGLSLPALLLAARSEAATVTGVQAVNRNGQTFITWDNLPGTNWVYHVYTSPIPFNEVEIENTVEVAQVGAQSAVDERISSLVGQTLTYRIDESAAPLPVTKGLFVHTPTENAFNYIAVFAERVGIGLDLTLVNGQNVTTDRVFEKTGKPRPVWQRRLTSPKGEDYVLWTTNQRTPDFPAMCNVPGRAFHVGVIPGSRGGGLVLHGHGRGGNFFNSFVGTGTPGEWVMSIDDYVPTGDFSTFYFGYEGNYDIEQPINSIRTTGVVEDFTERRVMYLLDWADATMPHDPARVYAMGVSMGGSFAFFLAWHHPERIAGALAVIPKICLGFQPDVFPELRSSLDRMWGSPDLNLPTTAGERVFQWMDGREQARISRNRGPAPIVGFCGLNDNIVGWEEKVAYFEAMRANRTGGAWFWDERGHYTPHETTDWFPMMASRQLYKYRNDMSYPAFSNCSTDATYGDGDPATADPIGNLNGAVDWDENTVNEMWLHWDVTLRTRALTTIDGRLGAPESLTVDVTPRRLQRFLLATGVPYTYEVRRATDDALVQSGLVNADQDAVITIPGVKVYAKGSKITLYPSTTTGVSPDQAARLHPHVALSRNPVQGKASLTVEWPTQDDATIDVYDLQGRHVRNEFRGLASGITEHTFRSQGLAPGVYLVSARQGKVQSTRRITVLD